METESGAALLALTPDGIFATRGVSEVIELHKTIQYEIERKREDLRAMVGERYRELIHAADTIGDMKATTERSLEHLGATVALCRNLHDTHLIGFRIPEKSTHVDRNAGSLSAQGVGVQVQLLLQIPERVWECVNKEDLLRATQLFILARHVNTGLQLQAGSKSVEGVISALRPLLERQWTSVSALHHTLRRASTAKLQHPNIKHEVACSCLLSLILLEPQWSLLDLLNTLISLHGDGGLRRTLERPASTQDDAREVGSRIVASAALVVQTIHLVQVCFVEEGGLVMSRLSDLYRQDSTPLIDLVQFKDVAAVKLLPQVISSYRLTPNKEMKPLSKEEVSDAVTKWTSSVRSYVQDRVKTLLNNISNAKTLHQIREDGLKIEMPNNWKEICESLSLPPIDVWSEYFQPMLTARVKQIIDTKWLMVYETFKSQMLSDLMRVSEEDCDEKEADLNWFVWKDLIGDTVIESREKVVEVMTALMKGMWQQDRGFSPTLERLCCSTDRELRRLLADLAHYAGGGAGARGGAALAASLADGEARCADRPLVQAHLREVAARTVESMLKYIKDECFENPNLQTSKLKRQTTAIYTARFIQALTHLMPNLKSCFIPKQLYLDSYELKDDEEVTSWNETCSRLKQSCLYCWGKWVDIAMNEVEILRDGLPREFTVEANLDYLLMQWDVIEIDEKDEEGNPVKSTIKIPSVPSLKLQQFLYAVSRILDQIVPHTLPIEIHSSFIDKLADITLSHYNKVIRENEMDINQKCALQLLMDVRHTTLLLVSSENKKCLDLSQEICEFLKKMIDPFDYDVFYPYIQTNVKKSVLKIQSLLGSLWWGRGGTEARPLGAGSADRSPALLAPADAAGSFTLLPVTAPAVLVRKDKARKKPASVGSAAGFGLTPSAAKSTASEITELMSTSLSGAKSGAAAFFGDWFSS